MALSAYRDKVGPLEEENSQSYPSGSPTEKKRPGRGGKTSPGRNACVEWDPRSTGTHWEESGLAYWNTILPIRQV